jgi:hypothetical protein
VALVVAVEPRLRAVEKRSTGADERGKGTGAVAAAAGPAATAGPAGGGLAVLANVEAWWRPVGADARQMDQVMAALHRFGKAASPPHEREQQMAALLRALLRLQGQRGLAGAVELLVKFVKDRLAQGTSAEANGASSKKPAGGTEAAGSGATGSASTGSASQADGHTANASPQ